mmetsp:Transcript_6844/g.17507  ORF Transcript_6844/g.17507 Transcript_6844/m.17507 type:complete len:240 (-) Transcript_6844:2605-3324(-)
MQISEDARSMTKQGGGRLAGFSVGERSAEIAFKRKRQAQIDVLLREFRGKEYNEQCPRTNALARSLLAQSLTRYRAHHYGTTPMEPTLTRITRVLAVLNAPLELHPLDPIFLTGGVRAAIEAQANLAAGRSTGGGEGSGSGAGPTPAAGAGPEDDESDDDYTAAENRERRLRREDEMRKLQAELEAQDDEDLHSFYHGDENTRRDGSSRVDNDEDVLDEKERFGVSNEYDMMQHLVDGD